MTLKEKAIVDQKIIAALKVGEIKHVVAHTDKGDLALCLRKNVLGEKDKEYYFALDAIPYNEHDNKLLLELFEGTLYNN